MNQETNSLLLLSEIDNANFNEQIKIARELIIPDIIQDPFPFLTSVMQKSGWAVCYVDLDEENLMEYETDVNKLKYGSSSKAINLTKLKKILQKSIVRAGKTNNRYNFFLDLDHEESQNIDMNDINIFNTIESLSKEVKLSSYVSFIASSSLNETSNGGVELEHTHKLRTDISKRKNILVCMVYLYGNTTDTMEIKTENIFMKKIINTKGKVHVGIFFDGMNKNFHTVIARKLYQAYMLKAGNYHNKKVGFKAFVNNQFTLLNESLSGETSSLDNEDTTNLSLLKRLFRGLEFNDMMEIYHHCLLLIQDNFQILEIAESKGNNGDLTFDNSRYTREETNIALMYRSYKSTYSPTSLYTNSNNKNTYNNEKDERTNIRKFYITGRNTSTSNELHSFLGSAQSDEGSSIINDAQLSYDSLAKNEGLGEQGIQGKIHQASIKLLQIIHDELSVNEDNNKIDITMDLFGVGTGATQARFFLNEIIKGANGELCNVLSCGENTNTNLHDNETEFKLLIQLKHFQQFQSYHDTATSQHTNWFINGEDITERKLFYKGQSKTSSNRISLSYSNEFTTDPSLSLDNLATIHITLNFLGLFDTISSIKSKNNTNHRWNLTGSGGLLPNTTKERFLFDGFNLVNSCGIPYEINIDPNSIARAVHITAGDESRDNYRLNSLVSINSFLERKEYSFVTNDNNQEIFKIYDLQHNNNTMNDQDISSLIVHQSEPYTLRQSEKLQLPQKFKDYSQKNDVYNLEEYTMRGEHEDIGGGYKAISDEIPKAGISFFKTSVIQAIKDKLDEKNCLSIANLPENADLLEQAMEEIYQYINRTCTFLNTVATNTPKEQWYRNNKRKASRNLLRYTRKAKEYKIQYYQMLRRIFGLISFHFETDELDRYEEEIDLAEKILRRALDFKMDYNFNNLFSPYFGLYTEDYRYKYQIENEFNTHSAFLSRNIMGELSNVYLKCMYKKAHAYNVPFDFNNLYYKHGVKVLKGTLTEQYDMFYVTNVDEEPHTFNQLMNMGISTDMAWYDIPNIMPLFLSRDCLATQQPIQDIREELKTKDTELLLIDGRVPKSISYDESNGNFICKVSSGEPYSEDNDDDDDDEEMNDSLALSYSPNGIILMDEEVYSILKNSPMNENDMENNNKYQLDTSYYELMILLPKKHNDKYIENIKIDIDNLFKTNNIMDSVTDSQKKEYQYNEYNSSFAIDKTENLITIGESLPKIFSKDIHMENDTDKHVYNIGRLLKNLYIHHGENAQLTDDCFNNYTNISENNAISDNILDHSSNKNTNCILNETISMRMVYYNDVNRAHFTCNLNTLKMNKNFYKLKIITTAEYEKIHNPSLKTKETLTTIEDGKEKKTTLYLELAKQDNITTEDILTLIKQEE